MNHCLRPCTYWIEIFSIKILLKNFTDKKGLRVFKVFSKVEMVITNGHFLPQQNCGQFRKICFSPFERSQCPFSENGSGVLRYGCWIYKKLLLAQQKIHNFFIFLKQYRSFKTVAQILTKHTIFWNKALRSFKWAVHNLLMSAR